MGTRPAAGEELMGHSAAGAAVSATAAASRCWYESAFEIGARSRKPAKHAPTFDLARRGRRCRVNGVLDLLHMT